MARTRIALDILHFQFNNLAASLLKAINIHFFREADEGNVSVCGAFLSVSLLVYGMIAQFANPSVPFQNVRPLDTHELAKTFLLYLKTLFKEKPLMSYFITTWNLPNLHSFDSVEYLPSQWWYFLLNDAPLYV